MTEVLFSLSAPTSQPSSLSEEEILEKIREISNGFPMKPVLNPRISLIKPIPKSIAAVESSTENASDPSDVGHASTINDSGYGTASLQYEHIKSPAFLKYDPTEHIAAISGQSEEQQGGDRSADGAHDYDDSETIYSDTDSIPEMKARVYIATLANDLFRNLRVTGSGSAALTLALQLGCKAPSQTHRDIMTFIHKYRNNYTSSTDLYPDGEVNAENMGKARSTEIMTRWLESAEEPDHEDLSNECLEYDREYERVDDDKDEMKNESNFPELGDYGWLLDRARRELSLSRAEPDIVASIRDTIFQGIPRTRKVSRRNPTQECEVIYKIDWDVMTFLKSQQYEENPSEAIADVITISGCHKDAQALSCRGYLAQTWSSSGLRLLNLLQKLLDRNTSTTTVSANNPGEPRLAARLHEKVLEVKVSGIPELAVEIGEQLAWLGAALRSSPYATGVAECVPFVEWLAATINKRMPLRCNIKFRLEHLETSRNTNGQCWHDMFRGPVIASGFPIPRRPEEGTGLEIPLAMMASMNRTRYINAFNFKVFLKGFSTMLVPTRRCDDIVVWHLLHNKSAHDRISYLDCDIHHEDVTIPELEYNRHIVGWCSEALCYKSQLPIAGRTCSLEKLEVTAGQFVLGTAGFKLSNKEKPVHISRFGYLNKLQWLSSKYIVLWDDEDKRGYLTNGVSAVLHLLRASLIYSKQKLGAAFLFDPEKLADAKTPFHANSALEVLLNEDNRSIKLYVDSNENDDTPDESSSHLGIRQRSSYYRLQDRVEHIYNTIEKLVDHQIDVERRDGLHLNPRPRRRLEGWDFRDLVTDDDPFLPRVATLPTIGKGWVDFTRSLRAVTLFGRGFGELIRPKQEAVTNCSLWASLPRGKYYLSACVSDLVNIMEAKGDPTANPRRLCDGILWHMKQTTFRPCPCRGHTPRKHHDPVQVLFPLNFRSSIQKKPSPPLEEQGAVIFGHNTSLHWHWTDNGDPVKGDPPEHDQDGIDPFYDSGIGSTLTPSPLEPSNSGISSALFPGSITPASSHLDKDAGSSEDSAPPGSKRRLRGAISSMSKKMKFR
ncbi:hypothetical protein F4777DRAFT_587102 [Nemania sp. FL0916]|nr:hypothetical protein F4777DRAFT_587102 [Nemania sp. FL0916]